MYVCGSDITSDGYWIMLWEVSVKVAGSFNGNRWARTLKHLSGGSSFGAMEASIEGVKAFYVERSTEME